MLMKSLWLAILLVCSLPTWADSANDSPQELLQTLYRVHNKDNGSLMDPDAGAERARFFTASLALALEQELNQPERDGVGNLGFDLFYNAQDYDISDFDIAVPKVSGTEVTALVHFRNFGENVDIGYRLIQDASGWRIDDIDYGDGQTLRKLLAGE